MITGTIDTIFDPVTKGNYNSRKMWIVTKEQYPQTLEVECGGKLSGLFDNLQHGQEVTLHVNLKGRKWQATDGKDRVFNSIGVYKVEASTQPTVHHHAPNMQNSTSSPNAGNYNPDDKDDLPFLFIKPKIQF